MTNHKKMENIWFVVESIEVGVKNLYNKYVNYTQTIWSDYTQKKISKPNFLHTKEHNILTIYPMNRNQRDLPHFFPTPKKPVKTSKFKQAQSERISIKTLNTHYHRNQQNRQSQSRSAEFAVRGTSRRSLASANEPDTTPVGNLDLSIRGRGRFAQFIYESQTARSHVNCETSTYKGTAIRRRIF